MKSKGWIIMSLLILCTACAAPSLEEFRDSEPYFDFPAYFTGPVKAYGVIRERGGKVTRSFVMDMHGSWDGERGRLEEQILFSDGETQQRAWDIVADGQDRWIATAADVVGEGVFRRVGSAMRLDYVLRIPYKGSTLDVTVEDWLYLQPDGVIVNQSILKKWGFRVGDILTTMVKPGHG
jgi:hypothetical protein